MNKRQAIDLFRQYFHDLPIPTDLRKIRTRQVMFGPSEPFMGHQQLTTTAYTLHYTGEGSPKPVIAKDVTEWNEMKLKFPIGARHGPFLICNRCRIVRTGEEYLDWYLR